MGRTYLAVGAALAALAVMIGAFGAHALKTRVSAEALVTFETGARYHMYHALALVAVGLCWARFGGVALHVSGISFAIGIVLFSGSLYALSLSGIRVFGAITPLGGVAFITGWIALAVAALRSADAV